MKEMIKFLKKTLEEAKGELPSVGLQLASLGSFMDTLGYVYKNPNGTTFVYTGADRGYPKELSWKDAVVLHNAGFFTIEGGDYKVPKRFSPYRPASCTFLTSANGEKPLERIYLQWNKKKKSWQVTKNRVKFNEEYFNG